MSLSEWFTRVSNQISRAAGHPSAFMVSSLLVMAWAVSGPFFNYSDTWLLMINTITTIVTFLMVFLIQNTQNRDGAALQAKLSELIRVSEGSNAFIGIEHLSQEEVDEFRARCEAAAAARNVRFDNPPPTAHETDEAFVAKLSKCDSDPRTTNARQQG